MTLWRYVLQPKLFALSPRALTTPFLVRSTQKAFHKVLACRLASVSASDDVFTWDDVVMISRPETLLDDPSYLKGYSEEIKICNRAFLDKLPIHFLRCQTETDQLFVYLSSFAL
ncbi:hypothetical protein L3X38_029288 [Prunus dulcis]|uniref:Uncharacterized protein n=1 Tax=Prunus dulcis TaxID=3755 RepID=A0AAD4VSC0_PRUDU|nr:hypothetical protein L3X38_029288 [Prunus dulcis]